MIFFKDLPTHPEAADNLRDMLMARGGGYSLEEITDLVDRGCSLSLAILRDMDDKLKDATNGLDDPESSVVQSIALTQLAMITKVSLEALALEAFLKMIGR